MNWLTRIVTAAGAVSALAAAVQCSATKRTAASDAGSTCMWNSPRPPGSPCGSTCNADCTSNVCGTSAGVSGSSYICCTGTAGPVGAACVCDGDCIAETPQDNADLGNAIECFANKCSCKPGAVSASCPGDAGATCDDGEVSCSGTCVDTQANPANCGQCGNACPADATCEGGQCVCPTGQQHCGDTCSDTSTDPANCGACGNACPAPANATATCTGSTCGSTCNSGTTLCSGQCADTTDDDHNCGACGTVCPSGQTCKSSHCVACSGTGSDAPCTQASDCCNGACVLFDVGYACGNTCTSDAQCASPACCRSMPGVGGNFQVCVTGAPCQPSPDAGGIVCATFTDNCGNTACSCLPPANVPSGGGYTISPACGANDCCVQYDPPTSNGITCECSSLASAQCQYGSALTCQQIAAKVGGTLVKSCP